MGINRNIRRTILVVEDFADTRELIGLWLRSKGYTVIEAADGPEAVELAGRERPDLVLMDVSLPTLDGLSATRRIRQIEEVCDVPVVACSAHNAREWAGRALAAGCNEYVTKPVDFAALERTITRLLPHAV